MVPLLFLAVAWVSAADDWSPFEPGSKVCRVALPDRPDETASRSVTSPSGRVELTTALVRTADGVYSVRITESDATINPQTLDDGVRQYAAAKRGTLGPVRSITVGPHPGREFELTVGSERARVRFVVAGGTLVVLAATGSAGAGVPGGVDRFLDSLRIGPADGAEVATAEQADAESAAKARAAADAAERTRAEAAAAERTQAEAELARLRQETATQRDRANAARREADSAQSRARAQATEFADKPDPTVTITEADKDKDKDKDDDPKDAPGPDGKDAGKPAARKSSAPTRVVIARLPKGAKPYADDQLVDLKKPFGFDRDRFRDVGPEGSVLVGVRVTFVEKFGGPKIQSTQPVYRSSTGKEHYAGRAFGSMFGPVTTVVARPGYAVGGLVTHTGLGVDGFGIVFMRFDGDQLDPSDAYNSPWIGDRNGGSPGQVMSRGDLVVGLQGRAEEHINGLSLTTRKRSGANP